MQQAGSRCELAGSDLTREVLAMLALPAVDPQRQACLHQTLCAPQPQAMTERPSSTAIIPHALSDGASLQHAMVQQLTPLLPALATEWRQQHWQQPQQQGKHADPGTAQV